MVRNAKNPTTTTNGRKKINIPKAQLFFSRVLLSVYLACGNFIPFFCLFPEGQTGYFYFILFWKYFISYLISLHEFYFLLQKKKAEIILKGLSIMETIWVWLWSLKGWGFSLQLYYTHYKRSSYIQKFFFPDIRLSYYPLFL